MHDQAWDYSAQRHQGSNASGNTGIYITFRLGIYAYRLGI